MIPAFQKPQPFFQNQYPFFSPSSGNIHPPNPKEGFSFKYFKNRSSFHSHFFFSKTRFHIKNHSQTLDRTLVRFSLIIFIPPFTFRTFFT